MLCYEKRSNFNFLIRVHHLFLRSPWWGFLFSIYVYICNYRICLENGGARTPQMTLRFFQISHQNMGKSLGAVNRLFCNHSCLCRFFLPFLAFFFACLHRCSLAAKANLSAELLRRWTIYCLVHSIFIPSSLYSADYVRLLWSSMF